MSWQSSRKQSEVKQVSTEQASARDLVPQPLNRVVRWEIDRLSLWFSEKDRNGKRQPLTDERLVCYTDT